MLDSVNFAGSDVTFVFITLLLGGVISDVVKFDFCLKLLSLLLISALLSVTIDIWSVL
jgi:hypothetical protein